MPDVLRHLHPKLDDKGRLFLPAKFRDELAEGLVVTRGQERCLTVWPLDDFRRLHRPAPRGAGHQQEHPRLRPHAVRRRQRGGAGQAGPDRHPGTAARVRLADARTSSSSASMDRIEIWDPTRWATYSAEQEQKFAELSDEVFPGI